MFFTKFLKGKERQLLSNESPVNESVDLADIKAHLAENPIIEFYGARKGAPLSVNCDTKGRFVRFSLQTKVCFHLDTIEIYNKDGRNVANNKRTIVSSCFNDDDKYDGRGALPGNKKGGCGFHTKTEPNPWLVVDLGSIRNLDKIVVYNRCDIYAPRAHSLMIEVSRDLRNWSVIHDNWKPLKGYKDGALSKLESAILKASVMEPSEANALVQAYKAQGNEEMANYLISKVNKLVSDRGVALGPHGFTQTFSLMPESKKNDIARELSQMFNLLKDDFGVEPFVSSGTLLGIVRDGDYIPHDDDLDVCYVGQAQSEKEVVEERRRLCEFLNSKGYRATPSNVAHVWCKTPGGVALDIFTGFIENDCVSMNPLPRNQLKKEAVLPLKQQSFRGHQLYLPNSPDEVLSLNYGPNWRTPDKSWKFSWKRAKSEYSFLYFENNRI